MKTLRNRVKSWPFENVTILGHRALLIKPMFFLTFLTWSRFGMGPSGHDFATFSFPLSVGSRVVNALDFTISVRNVRGHEFVFSDALLSKGTRISKGTHTTAPRHTWHSVHYHAWSLRPCASSSFCFLRCALSLSKSIWSIWMTMIPLQSHHWATLLNLPNSMHSTHRPS